MLITNDAFLISSKLLVLSTAKRWGTLLRCHTQLIQLGSISVAHSLCKHKHTKKKEELYVLKRQHRWQLPLQQCDVILLDWAAGSFSLTLLLFSSFKMTMRTSLLHTEQWAVITSLAVTATLTEMFWCTTTFQKSVILCVWQLIQLTEINTLWLWIRIALMYNTDEFSSDSMWYIAVQTEHSLSSTRMTLVWESEHTEWAAADQQRELNQHQQPQEWEQQHTHCKNEGSVSCQLWDTYLYDTYIVVVVDVVAAELVIQESVLTYSIKKGFTYKSCEWRSWRRKKREVVHEVRVYNSLHWQISSSELLKKPRKQWKIFICKPYCTKQANMCQQTLTTVQQPFQSLKHNLEEKKEVMSWVELILRSYDLVAY
jgi:hypothetical protein